MNEEVKIKATDGSGAFSAFISLSEKADKAPALVVIQEIFGVNKNMREICAEFSRQGYVAICPDLFWRRQPGIQLTDQTEAEWKRAFELYQGFDVNQGIADLKATLEYIRGHKACNGRAGALGYCLGGKLAYMMATRSDADCIVSYYGVGIEELLGESAAIRNPVLLHIAEKDKFVPHAAQQKILAAFQNNGFVETHVYPGADHAFARLGGQHYDETAARLSNFRTADFLAKHLAGK